jgi:glutamine amidotransferase
MNCATPTDFSFSLQGFCQRGGVTDIHSDGWGLAFYQGKGVRAFHDVEAASTSPIAKFLSTEYEIKTYNMMAHIRYATRGGVELTNVHPFIRELWGIQWCFAHNGDVPMFGAKSKADNRPCLGNVQADQVVYHAVGDTDSERVFCALLNALRAKFQILPSLPVLHDTLQSLCREIVDYNKEETILNFLLSCGPHTLWVYSWPGCRPGSNVWNGLHYTVREPPFQMCALRDLDYVVDFAQVTSEHDRVAIIATKPLTTLEEKWVEMTRGELILFDQGIPHKGAEDCFIPEFHGHGLDSNVMEAPRLQEDLARFRLVQQQMSQFAGGGI